MLAAHALGQIARDRQAQAGAAVAAAGAAVGLAEGFEDDLQLLAGDADAGVADLEPDAAIAAPHVQADLAVLGELHRVGQQVLQDLLQALAVDHQLARCQRIGLDLGPGLCRAIGSKVSRRRCSALSTTTTSSASSTWPASMRTGRGCR
jgi:hypothetical protein